MINIIFGILLSKKYFKQSGKRAVSIRLVTLWFVALREAAYRKAYIGLWEMSSYW
uniref:Uncharacterized protein n=1 Tax=Brassica oleracea TaxID=3712 RepID=A0A3P6FN47_BRAOL|nr:unnamed protein product [Brassica oleracea]